MSRRPLWLWPNLLSLDAPIIALAWFWMYKQVWLVKYHQPTLPWFLALTVWCIYVADRLMDERLTAREGGRPTARHRFHRRFQHPLKLALVFGVCGALYLLAIQSRGLLIHGLPILLVVFAYILISIYENARRSERQSRQAAGTMPEPRLHLIPGAGPGSGASFIKNIIAGVGFAYGVAVGVHFQRVRPIWDLALSPEVVVFAVLCIINMVAIDHWETSARKGGGEEAEMEDERETRAFFRVLLLGLLLALIGCCYLLAVRAEDYTLQMHKAFYLSLMVGAGGLAFLVLLRDRFCANALRVLADVAMLLPLPFFYFYLVDYEIIEFGQVSWSLTAPESPGGG